MITTTLLGMTKKLRVERLSQLKELGQKLPSVPDHAFNMDVFISGKFKKPKSLTKINCGFAACAIGWMPTLVKRCEIKMIAHSGGEGRAKRIVCYNPKLDGIDDSWLAVRHYFGFDAFDDTYAGDRAQESYFLEIASDIESYLFMARGGEGDLPEIVGARILTYCRWKADRLGVNWGKL